MRGTVEVAAARVVARESFLEKVGPHAPQIMLAGCAIGLIASFLPAVTVSLLGASESVAVWRDWRGKLVLLGYFGVGVMAVMMMKDEVVAARKRVVACAIAASVVLVAALWLPLSIKSSGLGSAVSMGIGVYVNILAAVGLAAGTVIQAKCSKLF